MNDTGLELFAIGLGIVSLILFVLTVSNRVTFFQALPPRLQQMDFIWA